MANSNRFQQITGKDSYSGAQTRGLRRPGANPDAFSPPGLAADTGRPTASIWLYVGGLCVTLSGLFAVNYGHEEPAFAMTTYVVAIVGYACSYLFRRYEVGFESLRLPLLVLVGLGLFAWLSAGPGENAGDGHSVVMDRSHALETLCVCVALLQPFASFSDMAVLFSCVPCMSLIALVSTTSPDSEVQYSFLVFIAAATFLMVHENYLRTRSRSSVAGAPQSDRKLFGGQLQLAMGCVVCAFVLANLVAVPMRAFGTSISIANGWGQAVNYRVRAAANTAGILSDDSQTLAIGTGPVIESDLPVMRVEAPPGLNWRGSTYDYYTGRAFENRLQVVHRLATVDEAADLQSLEHFHRVGDKPSDSDFAVYRPNLSPAEPLPSEMKGARSIRETVTVLVGAVSRCYAPGFVREVQVPRDQALVSTDSGGLFATTSFAANAKYHVTSVVPTDDETVLRASSKLPATYPGIITARYLQLAPFGVQESDKLRQLARQITAGMTNTLDMAAAIRSYIARTCKYNLQAPAAPADSDRVENFLTVSKQGYCDSFAASMTMLCRYAGIPSRVASGYITGQADGQDAFIVRQKDKHAWSEVYFPGVGWAPFDATDGSEDISNHREQARVQHVSFFGWIFTHGILPPILLAALAVLTAYLLWTELIPRLRPTARILGADGRPASNIAVLRAYHDACNILDRRGLRRARSSTPSEFLEEVLPRLTSTSTEAIEAFKTATALHDRFHYGRETATGGDVREAEAAAVRLRTALSRVSARTLASLQPVPQTT